MTIILSATANFRSLGGLPAADGRRIRPHALMRAQRLCSLVDDDWHALGRTGLATVCDLRSTVERAEHPDAIPPRLSVREIHCEVRNDLRADATLGTLLAIDPTARGAEQIMIEIYRRFPETMRDTLATITGVLIDGGAPLLVHCSAGKDRTGFVMAMLLHALGVAEAAIRADYLASQGWPGAEVHREPLEAYLRGGVARNELRAAVDAMLGVRDAYLDAALGSIVEVYGSVDLYLESGVGLDATRRDLLRERLLA